MKELFTFTGVKADDHTQPWELCPARVSLFTLFHSNLDAMKPLTGGQFCKTVHINYL